MLAVLIKISSYFPIFSFTDDQHFGEVIKKSQDLRFSFFRTSFGINKFYFLTIKNKCFKIFYKLNLYKVQSEPAQEEIENKGKQYEELIKDKSEDSIRLHIEVLKHKISQSDATTSRTFNKILYYNALYLVLLPFLILWLKGQDTSFTQILIFIVLIYVLINIYLFLYQFLKVSSFYRFPFREFKNNDSTPKQLAKFLYQEWYASRKGVLYVTYVKNIEKYAGYSMLCMGFLVCLLLSNNIKTFIDDKIVKPYTAIKGSSKIIDEKIIFDLSLDEKEFFNKNNLYKLNNLKEELLNGQIKQILILSSETKLARGKYKKIFDLLQLYNLRKIPINQVDLGTSLDKKQSHMTILILRR